ncbi:MAG: hypothetical protein LCH74_03730 [Proteobacteria bacterium]|nr:hypothetical protein [Pseudomonadota bacterium]
MPNTCNIHVCARCSIEHNSATTYDPPGWIWRGGRLYCDGCASLVPDAIDDCVPAQAKECDDRTARRENVFAQANRQIEKMARELSPTQRAALLQLRQDGRGDYDPRLTAARKALHQKGLADSPVSLGFGRNMIACLQHPTALGRAVAACLQKEAA